MSLYSACDKNPDPGKDDFGPDPSCGIMHRLSLMSWHLFAAVYKKKNIRIYDECEDRIEKSVPRIAIWHLEGRIFYHTLTRIVDSCSCSPLFLFIYLF